MSFSSIFLKILATLFPFFAEVSKYINNVSKDEVSSMKSVAKKLIKDLNKILMNG